MSNSIFIIIIKTEIKSSLGWLISQFEAIIEFYEPKEEQAEEET